MLALASLLVLVEGKTTISSSKVFVPHSLDSCTVSSQGGYTGRLPTVSQGPEPTYRSQLDPWQCLHIQYTALSGLPPLSPSCDTQLPLYPKPTSSRTPHTSFGAYSWESKGTERSSNCSFPAKPKAAHIARDLDPFSYSLCLLRIHRYTSRSGHLVLA